MKKPAFRRAFRWRRARSEVRRGVDVPGTAARVVVAVVVAELLAAVHAAQRDRERRLAVEHVQRADGQRERLVQLPLGLPVERVVPRHVRSEEHTSELQSQSNLVCRLLLEKKKSNNALSLGLYK